MKELILHGGRGLRMGPISSEIPKGFIPIRNKSNIERILIKSENIKEKTIIIPCGDHKIPEIIETKNLPLIFEEASEYHMQSVTEHLKRTDEPIIVWWGDTLASIDVQEMINHHTSSGSQATMALWETSKIRELKHWGSVILNSAGYTNDHPVPDMSEKGLIKAGVFIFEPRIVKEIETIATENWDMSNIINTLLLSEKFSGYIFSGYRINLNYGYDLIKAGQMIGEMENNLLAIDSDVKFFGRTELGNNVSIGANSEIHNGVFISNSILLDGVIVERGATVIDSVIGQHSRVEADSLVRRKMISKNNNMEITESPY